MKKQFLPTSVVLISLLMFSPQMAMADTLPIKPGKYEVVTSTGIRNDRLSEPKKTTRCLRAAGQCRTEVLAMRGVIGRDVQVACHLRPA